MQSFFSSRAGRLGLLALACTAFFFAWLGRQPFTDEGSVCHMAARLLDGRRLYAETWNEKSPLHFVIAAGWASLFGATVTSLRALAAFEIFVLLALVPRVAGELRWLAVATLLLVGPWYQAHHAVQEATVAPLALATVMLAAAGRDGGTLRLLLAGALFATGCWVKQSFATMGVAFASLGLRRAAQLFGAALAAALAWLLVFRLYAGEAIWLMPPFGERDAALPHLLSGWSEDRSILALHMAALAAIAVAARRFADDALARLLADAAFWLALPALLRPGAFRAWPSAVLAVVALVRIVAAFEAPARRRAAAAMLAVALLLGGARLAIRDGSYEGLSRVAARIEELTTPGDAIWVGPHEALLYCLSGRRAATRVDFALPWSPSANAKRELLAELEARPPKLLVDGSALYERWQGRLRDTLPGIETLLETRYRRLEPVEGFELYERR